MVGSDFSGNSLKKVNFKGSNLYSVNLKNSDLTEANLENADFTNANLENADFTNAKIFGADFTSAKTNGANMNDVDKTKTDDFYEKSDIGMLQKYSNLLEKDFSNSKINDMDISAVSYTHLTLPTILLV